MRFLLLIPVFVLFLSNVPFIQEMPVEKMMAIIEKQEEKGCCKKNAMDEEKSCHSQAEPQPEPGPMSCHPGKLPVEGACQPSGANCICICVFQYAGPAQDIKLFQFNPINTLAGHTGYLQVKWKDPHIASPRSATGLDLISPQKTIYPIQKILEHGSARKQGSWGQLKLITHEKAHAFGHGSYADHCHRYAFLCPG